MWIHGGAWFFGDRRSLPETVEPDRIFDALLAAGLAVASIGYRLSAEAPFPEQLHDTKAAIRYLRHFADNLNLDPSRIGVWGESAGGHLAALAALTGGPEELEGEVDVRGPDSSVRACVDWYGLSDLDSQPDGDRPVAGALPPLCHRASGLGQAAGCSPLHPHLGRPLPRPGPPTQEWWTAQQDAPQAPLNRPDFTSRNALPWIGAPQ